MSIDNTCLSVYEIDNLYRKAKSIFFIGIGGISMSSLASYCAYFGKEIFGYDRARSKITRCLEDIGTVRYYSTPDNVEGMDLVIYTTAIDEDNFEYRRAKEKKIPLISRANFLGYIISKYKHQIAVAGMHGKSTTTAMLFDIFTYAGRGPTVFCGAPLQGFLLGGVIGKGDTCIFEACEYKNAFHSLPATDGAILNIDYDHPDFFSGIDEIKDSFSTFRAGLGRVFINADDTGSLHLRDGAVTFGIENQADYMAKIIHSPGKNEFFVCKNGVELSRVELRQLGRHFVYDALCAFAVACENGIDPRVISYALGRFLGAKRRMEFLMKTDTGMDIFEDYAHHPREIECSLASFKEMGYKNVLCVYQAHTYSRTYYLYKEFTRCFKDAGSLVFLPIFPAREENIYPITDEGFARDSGGILISDPCAVADYIRKSEADACVIMGAGDIYKIKKYL
ncbi:MAG: hypothetical protein IJ309_02820 [Clostridia bacterium]|nr:hypothetical protein [Clostridia bacterium]